MTSLGAVENIAVENVGKKPLKKEEERLNANIATKYFIQLEEALANFVVWDVLFLINGKMQSIEFMIDRNGKDINLCM